MHKLSSSSSAADQYNSFIPSYMLEGVMQYYNEVLASSDLGSLGVSCSTSDSSDTKVQQFIERQMAILRSFERRLDWSPNIVMPRVQKFDRSRLGGTTQDQFSYKAPSSIHFEVDRFGLGDAAQPPLIRFAKAPPRASGQLPGSDSIAIFPDPAPRKVWGYLNPPLGATPELEGNRRVVLLYSTEAGFVNGHNPIAQTCFENMEKIDTFYRNVFLVNPVQRMDQHRLMEAFLHIPEEDAWWNQGDQAVHLGQPLNLRNLDTNLGVAAHEFGHAVVQYSAHFKHANGVDANEFGALNESSADISAVMVKHFQNQTLANSPDADWRIGEDCYVRVSDGQHMPMRLMDNPGHAFTNWLKIPANFRERLVNNDCQPADVAEYEALKAQMAAERLLGRDVPRRINPKTGLPEQKPFDNGGVHLFNSIPNRAFCLASKAIGGHTYGKPGQIWHESLMNAKRENDLLRRDRCIDDFATFARRTLQACKDLHYSGEVYNKLGQAWYTVGVDLRGQYPAEIPEYPPVNAGNGEPLSREYVDLLPESALPSLEEVEDVDDDCWLEKAAKWVFCVEPPPKPAPAISFGKRRIQRIEVFRSPEYEREEIINELIAGREVPVIDGNVYLFRNNLNEYECRSIYW